MVKIIHYKNRQPERIELSDGSMSIIAERVARKILPDIKKLIEESAAIQIKKDNEDALLSTEAAAKILGITPAHLRQIKDKYPYIKTGEGTKQGHLWFLRSGLGRYKYIKNYEETQQ